SLSRYWKALLRVHSILGLPHLWPVPRHLVRQHGRGDVLHAAAPDLALEVGDRGVGASRFLLPVLRIVVARRQSVPADDGAVRAVQPGRRVADATCSSWMPFRECA